LAARLDISAAGGHHLRMPDDPSRRIEKIESNLAHLEHQVEELNGVVIEQGKLIERLKKEVQRQSSAMQTLELERIKSNNSKPPHYQ
jgi:SlyX protein